MASYSKFFDIKNFKAETEIEKTMTQNAYCMIRMGDKIICGDWGIFLLI